MYPLIKKIIRTPKTVLSREELGPLPEERDILTRGTLRPSIPRSFRGSLAIRAVDSGSTNACEQELTALSNPYYDVERFGIHFVASPRHADVLVVTGPVTRNMKEALLRSYEAMPAPKMVVALGDDAITGGAFQGSYAVLDGVDKVIPVDFVIPGDPPAPGDILRYFLKIIEIISGRAS